ISRAASLTRPGLSAVTARPPGRRPGRGLGLPVAARVLLVPDDRLLASVVMAARWHGLVPALVDARLVPRLVGVVACLAFGRVQALVLPARFLAVTLAVFPSSRPVHLPTPFHCAGRVPPRRAAADRWPRVLALPTATPRSHPHGRRGIGHHDSRGS